MKHISSLFLLCFLLLIAAPGCRDTRFGAPQRVIAANAMVVTAHPLATEVGLAVLKQGGEQFELKRQR